MTTLDRVQFLHAATPEEEIKFRPLRKDGPPTLAYIDARYVMDVLDAAVGPGDWQDRYEEVQGGVRCGIGIRIGEEWIWKYDVGTPSDQEPVKGAYSDALKRAAVKWGIARDLYEDKPSVRVAVAQNGAPQPHVEPTPIRPAPAVTRSSTAVPEPPLDWDVLDKSKPEPFGTQAAVARDVDGTMTTKELLDRADSGQVPVDALAQASKKLYGPKAWQIKALTDVQRYTVAVEVGLA